MPNANSTNEFEMVKHIIYIPVLEELRLSECSIYKVPCNLREENKEAYNPRCISIGPIHLGKKELEPMQEHKLRYYHFFCTRVSNEQAMKNYKKKLNSKEQEIRQCYANKFDISNEKFVDMMLLDAVFIMELLLTNCPRSNSSNPTESVPDRLNNDLISKQSWLRRNITRDMILLENQIPFFVLQILYDDVVPVKNKKQDGFFNLAFEYFALYDTQMNFSDETKKQYLCCLSNTSKEPCNSTTRDTSPKHFTDLIRNSYLIPTHENKWVGTDHVLRTATKLQESGLSFEKVEKRRLLDINFERKPILSFFLCFGCFPCMKHCKARFRIPQLKVNHTTECVFRNLIAFEQCHYPDKPYICNYVSLIDSLIHTRLDVELLVEKEVIVHELGSDKEVATLVNGLSKHVVTNSTRYGKIINDLNDHYMNDWNHTVAALRLVYFRDLWRASSTVVGIAVLVFTAFQFVRALRALF
ncbi:UPF0481 protein, partial [Mucuna pruriens]